MQKFEIPGLRIFGSLPLAGGARIGGLLIGCGGGDPWLVPLEFIPPMKVLRLVTRRQGIARQAGLERTNL